MNIITRIENKRVTFNEAVDLNIEILSALKKYSVFTEVGETSKKMLPLQEISREYVSQILAKQIKKDLLNKEDLNSSQIGFQLFLIAKTKGIKGYITMRFGTPEISGRDSVFIQIENNYGNDKFAEIMPEVRLFVYDLIRIADPYKVVCSNYNLEQALDDRSCTFGYIMYNKSKLPNLKHELLESYGKGLVWSSRLEDSREAIQDVLELRNKLDVLALIV